MVGSEFQGGESCRVVDRFIEGADGWRFSGSQYVGG